MRSNSWSKFTFARLCVILRLRVFIIYVGACYTRGARSLGDGAGGGEGGGAGGGGGWELQQQHGWL